MKTLDFSYMTKKKTNRKSCMVRVREGLLDQARDLGIDVNTLIESALEKAIVKIKNK